jgi:hypothetical protein
MNKCIPQEYWYMFHIVYHSYLWKLTHIHRCLKKKSRLFYIARSYSRLDVTCIWQCR